MLISPRLQRSVFTTAFVTCGLVTLLVGGAFNYVMFLWAKHAVDLELSLVLTLIGVLVLAVAFLPDDWPRGDTGGSSRRRLSFRFLLGFAGLGFVLGLFVTLSPPRTFQSIREAIFWLCPAGTFGMLNGSSFGAVLFTAFVNGAIFGALGGVMGTVLSPVLNLT